MPGENARDPRIVLKREKYFTLRPRPLEQWLWRQCVAPAAERVFWLHWQEGMRNADWCSEIPIRRVAQQCCLDVSTVTRSYQQLRRLGLLRRQDPGRDATNPFQQATAITEVLLPRELLSQLDRHPNRLSAPSAAAAVPSAAAAAPVAAAAAARTAAMSAADTPKPVPARQDPFPGLSLKQRLRALAELTGLMSAAEKRQFDEAQRLHSSTLQFEPDSRLDAQQRAVVLQWLELCALKPAAVDASPDLASAPLCVPRRLSVFELASLRRQLQGLVELPHVPDRLREVVWSIEEGALRRFQALHAMRIALKKIREGLWSRPNRMPPNWQRSLIAPEATSERGRAVPGLCRSA